MDPMRFDRITRTFARRRMHRRSFLHGGSAAVAGLALGSVTARAQGTPVSGERLAEDGATLFVQTAAGGTFLPNSMASPEPGAHGEYLLTLSGHPGQTVGFSDRPKRDFGQVDTASFLEMVGFTPENPANAAIVVSTPAGEDDVLVVELLNPVFDDAAGLLIYEANILGEYAGDGLTPIADRQDDAELASEFDHVSLFIDDCPDASSCYAYTSRTAWTNIGPIPGGPYGYCWSWDPPGCYPCHTTVDDLKSKCNQQYAQCNNNCRLGY